MLAALRRDCVAVPLAIFYRGAHEYIGIAILSTHQSAMARQQRALL